MFDVSYKTMPKLVESMRKIVKDIDDMIFVVLDHLEAREQSDHHSFTE